MKAHELLASRKHWTKNYFARDDHDLSVPYLAPTARKWCIAGALLRCYPDYGPRIKAIKNTGRTFVDLVDFNDDPDTTHAQVLALLKKADI